MARAKKPARVVRKRQPPARLNYDDQNLTCARIKKCRTKKLKKEINAEYHQKKKNVAAKKKAKVGKKQAPKKQKGKNRA